MTIFIYWNASTRPTYMFASVAGDNHREAIPLQPWECERLAPVLRLLQPDTYNPLIQVNRVHRYTISDEEFDSILDEQQ